MSDPFGSIDAALGVVGLDDPEKRIGGSGKVHLDPAYNSKYAGERRRQELTDAEQDHPEDDQS